MMYCLIYPIFEGLSIVLNNIYYHALKDIHNNIQERQNLTEDGRREEAALPDREGDYQGSFLILFLKKMINVNPDDYRSFTALSSVLRLRSLSPVMAYILVNIIQDGTLLLLTTYWPMFT